MNEKYGNLPKIVNTIIELINRRDIKGISELFNIDFESISITNDLIDSIAYDCEFDAFSNNSVAICEEVQNELLLVISLEINEVSTGAALELRFSKADLSLLYLCLDSD